MVLRNNVPQQRGNSLQLVVAVHAWMACSAALSEVRETVANAMPDADLLFPDYDASIFSSADRVEVTSDLVRIISAAVASRETRGAP
jgi:hypothetical protein